MDAIPIVSGLQKKEQPMDNDNSNKEINNNTVTETQEQIIF